MSRANEKLYATITVSIYLPDQEAVNDADFAVDVGRLHRDIEHAAVQSMRKDGVPEVRVEATE